MKRIEMIEYKCDGCGKWYEDQDEAMDCSDMHRPELEIRTSIYYCCKTCKSLFDDKLSAISCEQSHEDGTDLSWQMQLADESKNKLIRAAMNENQTKLL